jgi:hypothetical protein
MCDSSLTGPEWLEACADAEEGCGNTINADVYRHRAKQWRDDLQQLEQCGGYPGIAHDLERAKQRNAELEHRIAAAAASLQKAA